MTIEEKHTTVEAWEIVKAALEDCLGVDGVAFARVREALAALHALKPALAQAVISEAEAVVVMAEAIKRASFGWISNSGIDNASAKAMATHAYRALQSRGLPAQVVDVEVGARACARWRNGKLLAYPDFEALSTVEKAAYREQATACARAWGLTPAQEGK